MGRLDRLSTRVDADAAGVVLDAGDRRVQPDPAPERGRHRLRQPAVAARYPHGLGRRIGTPASTAVCCATKHRSWPASALYSARFLEPDEELGFRHETLGADELGEALPVELGGARRALGVLGIDPLGERVERIAEAEVVAHDVAVATTEELRDRSPLPAVVGDGLQQLVGWAPFRLETEPGHERLDAVVVVVDRLATRLGMQPGRERGVMRMHTPADAIARLDDDDVPARLGEVDRRRQPRESRTHDGDPWRRVARAGKRASRRRRPRRAAERDGGGAGEGRDEEAPPRQLARSRRTAALVTLHARRRTTFVAAWSRPPAERGLRSRDGGPYLVPHAPALDGVGDDRRAGGWRERRVSRARRTSSA